MFRYRNFKNVGYNNSETPAVYSYETTEDTIAQVSVSGYFSDQRAEIREGDLIIARCTDGSTTLTALNSHSVVAMPSAREVASAVGVTKGYNFASLVAAAEAGDIPLGVPVSTKEYSIGTGIGGKSFKLVDAGSSGARPAEVSNFIIHINVDGLYLIDSSLIDVPSDVILPSGFYPLFGYVAGKAVSYTRPSDILNVSTWAKLYVDVENGDNANNGLTLATAKKSISAAVDLAISNAVATRIMIVGGVYSRFNSIHSTGAQKVLTAPISLEAIYGRVDTGPFETLTWTKTGGQTFVYQTTRSVAQQIFNPLLIDKKGNYTKYKAVASIALCDAEAGTWYTDNTTVYVHVHNDSPASDVNARVYLQARAFDFAGNHNIYLNGLDISGGTSSSGTAKFSGGSTNTVLINSCTFKYGAGGNQATGITAIDGVIVLGCKLFAAFNSEASFSTKDGWNLHEESGNKPFGYFVDCKGYENGLVISTTSCNGLTAHDGICGIAMGKEYLGSAGANVAFVDAGTNWLLVDVKAGNSEGDTIWGGTIDFGGFQSGTSAKTYLYYCEDVGSTFGLNAGSTGEIVIAWHKGQGSRAGTITTLF